MSPLVHGRIYPESDRSSLPRREFRILLDPSPINDATVSALLEIDVLRQYLHSLPGPPCRITFVAPANDPSSPPAAFASLASLGLEIVPFSTDLTAEATEALGAVAEDQQSLRLLVATALRNDIDVIAGASVPRGFDAQGLLQATGLILGDWKQVKRCCEIFVRGHDIPWTFSHPAWGYPWTPFYSIAEPDRKLIALWEAARTIPPGPSGLEPDALETLRSLALNRHAGLCYTRDKLLFYAHHDRLARRHPKIKADYAFQAGYHLNHYYLQLSAGLDQVCWVTNAVFVLRFARKEWRKVEVMNPAFLGRLREKAPGAARIFEEPDFVKWAKMLRASRNFVAHEGFSLPAEMYIRPENEPTEAELDKEIEASHEWKELAALLPPNLLDLARPTLRQEALLRRCKKIPERILKISIDGQEAFTYPLLNIEWDFDNFFAFAHKLADLALARFQAS